MPAQYAIETNGLTRRFGPSAGVERLDLRVPQGAIYGFLGLNGAGKTTTIRLVLGLIRADAGSVRLFGEPFRRDVVGRIGSLVESPSLYAHLTGRENLEVTRRQIGAPRASIDRVLTMVGLTEDAHRLVREYSLGMRQRLGLALALLSSPDLLIFDEPTNGLDPAGIHQMRDLLRRLPGEYGVTVFLSSHLLSEVEQVAAVIGIIDEGALVFEGPLAELRARQGHRIRVEVDAPGAALEILRTARFSARSGDPAVVIVDAPASDADRVNRVLVQHGQRVSHLSVQQDSLEDIFLSLTGRPSS